MLKLRTTHCLYVAPRLSYPTLAPPLLPRLTLLDLGKRLLTRLATDSFAFSIPQLSGGLLGALEPLPRCRASSAATRGSVRELVDPPALEPLPPCMLR